MRILIVAPHPDDEVLGCGGVMAKYADQGHEVYAAVVTKGWEPLFPEEDTVRTREDCRKSDKSLGAKETIFMDFPSVKLEEVPRVELTGAFTKLIQGIRPDIVYIPHRGDMQLDHKITVDAAMVSLRPRYEHVVKKILMYETLSETGWDVPNAENQFIPNVYEDISEYLPRKLEAFKNFSAQLKAFPDARSEEAVRALAFYRGATVHVNAAEAFSLVREIR